MNIFLSWSGERSKALAIELSAWLKLVIQNLKPWISSQDIHKGDRWFSKIGQQLKCCDIGLICVTPENIDASWLLFEAGALSKQLGESKVCPILLGMSPEDLEGPLAQFQATSLSKEDMEKLVVTLNDELKDLKIDSPVLKRTFETFWPELEKAILKITKIPIQSSNFETVIKALSGKGLPNPEIGRIVSFNEGFESHGLYETVFSLSKKRVYIFGRKNRKVFDKEHKDFFESLKSKMDAGFDFKCLFLDPDSPDHILFTAHEDDDFREQLLACHNNALKVLNNNGLDVNSICRMYNIHRTHAFVVSDNTMIFTPIESYHNGKSKHLTKCKFQVIDINHPLGVELLENFEDVWQSGKELQKNEI